MRILAILITVFLTSCIGTKYLKSDETILYKQKVALQGDLDKDAMDLQMAQVPNKKFLGLPISHLVQFYQLGLNYFDTAKVEQRKTEIQAKFKAKIAKTKSGKRKVRLNTRRLSKLDKLDNKLQEGNQFMRWGEPLSIFDTMMVLRTEKNIKDYAFTKGYFNAHVDTHIKTKGKRKYLKYDVTSGEPYLIDSLIFEFRDPTVSQKLQKLLFPETLKGQVYEQNKLSDERERVFELMANSGYYNFKRQYILFEVDSVTMGDHSLILRETIVTPPNQSSHKIFTVDSVVFVTESGISRKNSPITYKNITFDFAKNKYPVRVLDWRIFIEEDSIYRKNLTLETQKQLSYLDVFKFVNINYDSTGGQFVANIFTSPLKKYQTSTEAGLSMLDQANGLPGPFINFNGKSRNIFGGLEIIQLDGSASIQGISSVNTETNNYSRLQYGGSFSITFPQFLFPLPSTYRSRIGKYNPKTKISAGINFEDRRDEYERQTTNTSMTYIWQYKQNIQLSFKPFDASYIRSNNTIRFTEDVLQELERAGNLSLISAFKSSFVSFSAFNLDINENNYGLSNTNSYYLRSYLETGGNLQNILGKDPFGTGLEYYKYFRYNIDFRRNHRINNKSALAYRINVGVALPYGDNAALPYEKYFFAGGSNSIRAWQPRRLGPGAFASYDSIGDNNNIFINYQREQPGDVILESSIEYRHDLSGFIDYAFFLDAGNVWLLKSNTVDETQDELGNNSNGDDGVFRINEFYREIALGGGFGLRFDFSFLVLRVDAAYKIMDPAYPKGERFLLTNYQFNDLWNRNKVAINIGIGYPF